MFNQIVYLHWNTFNDDLNRKFQKTVASEQAF